MSGPVDPLRCSCRGYKYEKYIVLSNLKCEDLSKSKMPKLRFIVQNKWWYNPKGQVRVIDITRKGVRTPLPCGQDSSM